MALHEIDETSVAVCRLPLRQRAALALRFYEDLDEAEIARILGCGPRPAFAAQLIDARVEQAATQLAEMGEAAALGDHTAMKAVAHSLKGASATLGAVEVALARAALGAAAAAGRVAGTDELRALAVAVGRAVEALFRVFAAAPRWRYAGAGDHRGVDAGSIPVTLSLEQGGMPMFSLIYASSAVAEFSPSELVDLLKSCHERNAKLGVTGMLLYKDGNFMQAIEGDEDVVRDLYAKISLDPRHRGLMTLLAESVPERQFPDWSMGFRDLNAPEARSIPGYSQFMNIPLTDTVFSSDPAQCQKLLTTFRRTM